MFKASKPSGRERAAGRGDVVYIGVGSNKGDRRRNIRKALRLLQAHAGIALEAASPLYETRPVGGPPGQRDYCNGVVRLRTLWTTRRLLTVLKRVEKAVGRRPGPRWAAREVDLDILLRGGAVIRQKGLRVPHPRMTQRDFVLRPLADLAPGLRHPLTGKTVAAHLKACRGQQTLEKRKDR